VPSVILLFEEVVPLITSSLLRSHEEPINEIFLRQTSLESAIDWSKQPKFDDRPIKDYVSFHAEDKKLVSHLSTIDFLRVE